MNQYLNNPFLWALISMFTLVGACSVVGSRKIGSHPAIGWVLVTILSLGRIILVLPSNPWFYNRCCAGAGMVVRFSIFDTNRGRKLGACNRNEVSRFQEKGKGPYYSWDTYIGYLTRRLHSDVQKTARR